MSGRDIEEVVSAFEKKFRDSIRRSLIDPGDPLGPTLLSMAEHPRVVAEVMLAVGREVASQINDKRAADQAIIHDFLTTFNGKSRSYFDANRSTLDEIKAEVLRFRDAGTAALNSIGRAANSVIRRLLVTTVLLAWTLSIVGSAAFSYKVGSSRSAEETQLIRLLLGNKDDQQVVRNFMKGSRPNRANLASLAEKSENLVQVLTMVGLRAAEAVRRDDSVWEGCIANGPPVQTPDGSTVSTCLVEVSTQFAAPGPPTFLRQQFGQQRR